MANLKKMANFFKMRHPWRSSFKKTITTTATSTSPNKRFNEQYNGSARALSTLVHFLAVLGKTTTWNDRILRVVENVNPNGEILSLYWFGIERCLYMFSYRIVLTPIDILNSLPRVLSSKPRKNIEFHLNKLSKSNSTTWKYCSVAFIWMVTRKVFIHRLKS